MRFRRRLRVLGLGAVVALGLVSVVGAAPGDAAPAAAVHAITVTPSTGLSDGQTVTVTGTGFTETPAVNDWSVTECRAGIVDAGNQPGDRARKL